MNLPQLSNPAVEKLDTFDTDAEGEGVSTSPIGTEIRFNGRRRLCVDFDTLTTGQKFWRNSRDADEDCLTRTERPLSRCRMWRGRPVWIYPES